MARILIVEDEPLIAMMLEEWLTELSHTPVGPTGSVKKALAVVDQGGFDAAILDVNLAGQRCEPVATALAALGLPFAFATGDSISSLDPRFADRPSLSKPYDFKAVSQVVALLLTAAAAAPATSLR